MFITAAPRLGVKTLPELIALAKQRPGELAYGTNGPGRLMHLTGELLQSRTGIKLPMVPYSGGTAQVYRPGAVDAEPTVTSREFLQSSKTFFEQPCARL
jgi:hypothetical protein